MSWLRIDDQFPEHAKVMALNGPGVKWLHVVAMCQCAANLTDGFISHQRLKVVCAIADVPRPAHAVKQLVQIGLWEESGDGYWIRDYLDYNPDAETVKAQRDARAEAGRKGGTRSGAKRREEAEAKANGEANASVSASSKREARPVEPRPVPSPLEPKTLAAPPAAEPRKRDEAWEALLDVCGIEQASLTAVGRGPANKALKAIRDAGGANPADIRARAVEFRRKWPEIALTPMGLAKHWGALRPAEAVTESKFERLRGAA